MALFCVLCAAKWEGWTTAQFTCHDITLEDMGRAKLTVDILNRYIARVS